MKVNPATTEFSVIESGDRTIALVTGCDCEAPDPDECPCPDAAWFVRVDTARQADAWLDEIEGAES